MQKLLNLIGLICFCFHLGFLYWFLYRFCIVFCIDPLFPAPVGWQAMISSLTCPYTFVFWTVMLEKTLESPLDCKEIQPVNPKGNQSWIFIGRTDVEAETPILWPPDGKNWLIGQDPDAGKDWRWEEKGMADNEMVGWHHRLNGHEFEQAPGVGDGQGSLVCCIPWVHKETRLSDWAELDKSRLNP